MFNTKDELSPPVIVIGMHRSGTTLVSRILSECGIQMGDTVERNNESVCFLQINDILLRKCNASWINPNRFLAKLHDDSFIYSISELANKEMKTRFHFHGVVEPGQMWGWKDPRTTLTLPVWLQLFPNAQVIFIVRNGIDVALSLKRRAWRQLLKRRRNDVERLIPINSFLKGFHLWQLYCSHAIQCFNSNHIRKEQVHQLRYEKLIQEPVPQLHLLFQFLQIELPSHTLEKVSGKMIHEPTRRTLIESVLVRLLSAMNFLESSCLEQFNRPE